MEQEPLTYTEYSLIQFALNNGYWRDMLSPEQEKAVVSLQNKLTSMEEQRLMEDEQELLELEREQNHMDTPEDL